MKKSCKNKPCKNLEELIFDIESESDVTKDLAVSALMLFSSPSSLWGAH